MKKIGNSTLLSSVVSTKEPDCYSLSIDQKRFLVWTRKKVLKQLEDRYFQHLSLSSNQTPLPLQARSELLEPPQPNPSLSCSPSTDHHMCEPLQNHLPFSGLSAQTTNRAAAASSLPSMNSSYPITTSLLTAAPASSASIGSAPAPRFPVLPKPKRYKYKYFCLQCHNFQRSKKMLVGKHILEKHQAWVESMGVPIAGFNQMTVKQQNMLLYKKIGRKNL